MLKSLVDDSQKKRKLEKENAPNSSQPKKKVMDNAKKSKSSTTNAMKPRTQQATVQRDNSEKSKSSTFNTMKPRTQQATAQRVPVKTPANALLKAPQVEAPMDSILIPAPEISNPSSQLPLQHGGVIEVYPVTEDSKYQHPEVLDILRESEQSIDGSPTYINNYEYNALISNKIAIRIHSSGTNPRLVGFIFGTRAATRNNKHSTTIHYIWVADDFRETGYARLLFNLYESDFKGTLKSVKKFGVRDGLIEISMPCSISKAQHMWKKFGFQQNSTGEPLSKTYHSAM